MSAQFDWQVYGCIIWEYSLQIQDSNNADVLLDSRLKLSAQLLCALNYWIIFYTKNVMYLNIVYAHMLHCMIKLRPDLESAHQAHCFGIWFIQIRKVEADINELNILGLECIYLSGCSQFE